MAYIKFKRDFEETALYKKSSLEQLEVIRLIVSKVAYVDSNIVFDGNRVVLQKGNVWLGRLALLRELSGRCKAKFTESHIRGAITKLVKGGYLILKQKSRKSGSIYECSMAFYEEIAQPFDVRFLTHQSHTNRTPIAHQSHTNHTPKLNNNKALSEIVTHQSPQINHNLTTFSPQNNTVLKNKEKRIKNNDDYHLENSDFENSEKIVALKSDLKIERKKVAAKKESFDFPPPPISMNDPLENYFTDSDNLKYWGERFPLLVIESEFERIMSSLRKKAANGNSQLQNPYNYVKICLENAETQRQQRENSQNYVKNQKSKSNAKSKNDNWAAKNGKILDSGRYAAAQKQRIAN